MTRRSKPYRLIIDPGRPEIEIPAHKFYQYLANGWLVRAGKRLALLRDGVVAWIEEGALHLQDTITGAIAPWMLLNCRQIEREMVFRTSGPQLSPEARLREVRRQYVTN